MAMQMTCQIEPVKVGIDKQCLYCDFTSQDTRLVVKHKKLNCAYNTNKLFCPECKMEYFTKRHLDYHMLNQHYMSCLKYVTRRFYQCNICNHTELDKKMMLRHIRKQSHQVTCYQCNYNFPTKLELTQHFNAHMVNTFYQCSGCGFTASSKLEYDRHVVQDLQCQWNTLKYSTTGTFPQ